MKLVANVSRLGSTKYTYVKEFPLSKLEKYKNHRRLRTFYHKGTECANPYCDRVATRLIEGKTKVGSHHIDMYTDDLVLFTVDHIIPRSKGGVNGLENSLPMCQPCNSFKQNHFDGIEGFTGPTFAMSKSQREKWNAKRRFLTLYGKKWRKVVRRTESFVYAPLGDTLTYKLLTYDELKKGEIKA